MAGEEFAIRMTMIVRVEDADALLAAHAAADAERRDAPAGAAVTADVPIEDALQDLLTFPPVADLPGCTWGSTSGTGDQSTWSASIAVERVVRSGR